MKKANKIKIRVKKYSIEKNLNFKLPKIDECLFPKKYNQEDFLLTIFLSGMSCGRKNKEHIAEYCRTCRKLYGATIELEDVKNNMKVGDVQLEQYNDIYRTHSFIDSKYRRKGFGLFLYSIIIEFCLENGMIVTSSFNPSVSAKRVWHSKKINKKYIVYESLSPYKDSLKAKFLVVGKKPKLKLVRVTKPKKKGKNVKILSKT